MLLLGSCAMYPQWKEASPEVVKKQPLHGHPYHPLIYHMDLCILSYQLYAQSLVWPFDPYYEEEDSPHGDRKKHMAKVRAWASAQGNDQSGKGTSLSHYRGPGVLGGFPDNSAHDPIIYRYDRIHPWNPTITNADGRWTEYLTPAKLTKSIGRVYVCCRIAGKTENDVTIRRVPIRGKGPASGARDVLIAFEGGTGDKGEPGQPASQSLMGFVLLRHTSTGNNYDVHIAFRGSRSGSAGRAALLAIRTKNASGNPDWITDLGHRHLLPSEGGAHISTVGKVSRGFANSMESMLPAVFHSLRKVNAMKSGRKPNNIYVTGHSLGGALGQHFVSAVLLGNRYGPDAKGSAMPATLRNWPWKNIKLITFGAPRAGDGKWAKALSQDKLRSIPYLALMDPYDRKALPVAHPVIIPRLTNSTQPAAYRVLFSMDPITTKGIVGGNHAGRSIYVNEPNLLDGFMLWSFDAHEPSLTRRRMLASLNDNRIPSIAWRYRDMTELNPERNDDARRSVSEYRKIHRAIDRYQKKHALWYDRAAFNREFELFQSIQKLRTDQQSVDCH